MADEIRISSSPARTGQVGNYQTNPQILMPNVLKIFSGTGTGTGSALNSTTRTGLINLLEQTSLYGGVSTNVTNYPSVTAVEFPGDFFKPGMSIRTISFGYLSTTNANSILFGYHQGNNLQLPTNSNYIALPTTADVHFRLTTLHYIGASTSGPTCRFLMSGDLVIHDYSNNTNLAHAFNTFSTTFNVSTSIKIAHSLQWFAADATSSHSIYGSFIEVY